MHAEILSIGTELLLGEITDTNAQYISSRLRDIGVNVYRRITVGDNPGRLLSAFEDSIQRADVVIATGGLGPTDDDVTARCLALALKRNLSFDENAWDSMRKLFIERRWTSTGSDRKQAYIIDGGFFIPNHVGTAPGQGIMIDGKLALLLPGPPSEMKPMFENYVIPLIREHFPSLAPIHYVNLNIAGLGEARVAEALADLLGCPNPTVAPYAGAGQVRLRIAAHGCDKGEALAMISKVEKEVRRRLGHHVYGKNEETLEMALGTLLGRIGLTLAVAESVTGGLICHRLTEVPGSSKYFKMGMVAYSPKVKIANLGVPPEVVYRDQSVNEEAAGSMAESVRLLAGTDLGLATTGFAGPEGGTRDEPLGTVYIGLSHKKAGISIHKLIYPSSRPRAKAYAAQRALYVLYRFLVEHYGKRR
ncbi:MAG TPA: competence/damage-inducible protein A [Firmicutes bacterium]|nr:competence/damage-inducible protein A [Candidatus Fermentithermobacillaceae bacterium]